MLYRIGRVVVDVRTHAVLARELSIGLYEALSVLSRGKGSARNVLSEHHAAIESALPGF